MIIDDTPSKSETLRVARIAWTLSLVAWMATGCGKVSSVSFTQSLSGQVSTSQLVSQALVPAKSATRPIYEMFNGRDYFETALLSEGTQSKYEVKGIAFRVYTARGLGMIPLHRCLVFSSGDHFVSLARNCENQKFEEVYGYVYPVNSAGPAAGHAKLYRMLNSLTGDHAANTNPAPPAGYQIESVLGYVPVDTGIPGIDEVPVPAGSGPCR